MASPEARAYLNQKLLPAVAETAEDRRRIAALQPELDAWKGKVAREAARKRLEEAARPQSARPGATEPVVAGGSVRSNAGYLDAFGLNDLSLEQRALAAKHQFVQAPLGGAIREWAAGSDMEWLRHRGGQTAEQAAAGLLATGVGVPAFLAAVDALNGNEQTPGTIPLS